MTGVQFMDISNVQRAVDILLDKGCNTVIVTLGEQGAAYASQENKTIKIVSTKSVQPVDSTVRSMISFIWYTNVEYFPILQFLTFISDLFTFQSTLSCIFNFAILLSPRASFTKRICVRIRQLIYDPKERQSVESYR